MRHASIVLLRAAKNGLGTANVVRGANGSRVIALVGSPSQVEKALGVEIGEFARGDGPSFYTSRTAPRVPMDLQVDNITFNREAAATGVAAR